MCWMTPCNVKWCFESDPLLQKRDVKAFLHWDLLLTMEIQAFLAVLHSYLISLPALPLSLSLYTDMDSQKWLTGT